MSDKIVVAPVGQMMRQATDVAGVCRSIVLKTAQTIGKRRYVRVEGWQSIVVAYGCVASARGVEVVDGGIRAIGELRRMSDGAILAEAEGFVGNDEDTWASRPMYARRAMAQTRAISRACRSAFAFVVTLIDSGLSTTPAEEVPYGGFDDEPQQRPAPVPRPQAQVVEAQFKPAPSVRKHPAQPQPPPAARQSTPWQPAEEFPSESPGHTPPVQQSLPGSGVQLPPFGRNAGQHVSEVPAKDLQWYADQMTRSINDPTKAMWREKNEAMLAAIQEELAQRAGAQVVGRVPGQEG